MKQVCIIKNKLNIHLTQILDEQTLVTPSSIHYQNSIYPIEVQFIKALSINYIITNMGIMERDGKLIYQSQNIIDGYVINNQIFIQQPDQFFIFNTLNNESYIILSNLKIDGFNINYPKIAIESSYYYIFDDKTKSLIKVGNTEKNKKFGCVFYQQYLFCARPNGILWKSKMTGEVQSSYKFPGLKFNNINIITNFLLNITQNQCNIINLDDMSILNTIDFIQDLNSKLIYFSNNKLLYYYEEYLYQLQILDLYDAFILYAQQGDQKAIELFQNYSELQTYNNSLKLLKFKSQNIQDMLHLLQTQQFKLNFINRKQLNGKQGILQLNLSNISKQCCKYSNIQIKICEYQIDINQILNKINNRVQEYQGICRLKKYLINIDCLNTLHYQILKHLNKFMKSEIIIIQQNFKYCRNLYKEDKFIIELLRQWIKYRNNLI